MTGKKRSLGLPEQKLVTRITEATSAGGRRPELQSTNFRRLIVDKSEHSNLQGHTLIGSPQYCEIYFQELVQVLSVNIGQKSPQTFGRGKSEGTP